MNQRPINYVFITNHMYYCGQLYMLSFIIVSYIHEKKKKKTLHIGFRSS